MSIFGEPDRFFKAKINYRHERMENFNRKKHWETIYETKALQDVSWYQPKPETSLQFIKENNIPSNAKIIDVGGGDSLFVDHLLDLGYRDITVLDISETAIDRARKRLGDQSRQVKWIVADASDFTPPEKYDFWHDRAAFHFLTNDTEISNYIQTAAENLNPDGIIVIGTFSAEGPKKCSGINITQYSEKDLTSLMNPFFEKISCFTKDHNTPFNTVQNFLFCSFRRID